MLRSQMAWVFLVSNGFKLVSNGLKVVSNGFIVVSTFWFWNTRVAIRLGPRGPHALVSEISAISVLKASSISSGLRGRSGKGDKGHAAEDASRQVKKCWPNSSDNLPCSPVEEQQSLLAPVLSVEL